MAVDFFTRSLCTGPKAVLQYGSDPKCLDSQLWVTVILSSEESRTVITGEPAITRELKRFSKIHKSDLQAIDCKLAEEVSAASLARVHDRNY